MDPKTGMPIMNQEMAHIIMQRLADAENAPPVPAPPEHPNLVALLDPLRLHMQIGGEKFEHGDLEGAVESYLSVVTAAGNPQNHGSVAWPQVEDLVFACRSNAADCLLRTARPERALAECDAALALPCADGCEELLSTVLVLRLQALIDASRPRQVVFGFLESLRRRGSFDRGAAQLTELTQQVARMCAQEDPDPEQGNDDDDDQPDEADGGAVDDQPDGGAIARAWNVLIEHWLETGAVSMADADAATDRIGGAAEDRREETALDELAKLAGPARKVPGADAPMSIADVLRSLCGGFSTASSALTTTAGPPVAATAASAEDAAMLLRFALLGGGMHPSHPGAMGGKAGSLLSGLADAFERSLCSADDVDLFLCLARILVTEAGANIDQRAHPAAGRRQWTPLMHTARSGSVGALRGLLDLGACVHLRDEEGFTPLICCCRDPTAPPPNPHPNPNKEHIACARALLHAGADVDAASLTGIRALQAAAMHEPRPHYAMMETLLEAGASTVSARGEADSVATLLERRLATWTSDAECDQDCEVLARMIERVSVTVV
jgi:hypothetical protein